MTDDDSVLVRIYGEGTDAYTNHEHEASVLYVVHALSSYVSFYEGVVLGVCNYFTKTLFTSAAFL